MEKLLQYKEILKRYRNGEFGEESMHLNEILEAAGYPNILEEMTSDELQTLADESFGISKSLYLSYRKKKQRGRLSI